MTTSEWTICVTPMPTEEALNLAARIADAEEPDCEDLLFVEGPQVCDVLRCEVLHQAEVIERRTAELSTATGEVERLRARLAETPTADEADYLDALLARQHAILTGVADALRGDPGPLASHSHHDLAERAAAVVAMLAVTQSSLEAASSGRRVTVVDDIERLQREIATLRAAYATDLDGLRAELRRADDERATWRDLRDAAREHLDALEAPAPVWDADESDHDGHAARLEVARVALRALVAAR